MGRSRIQAFCYQWPGTAHNHAGMAYFAQCLKNKLGIPFSVFYHSPQTQFWNNLSRHFTHIASRWLGCLFFMEYLTPIGSSNQENLAIKLRQEGVRQPMVGLVHLPERLLLKYWKLDHIRASLDAVDHIIVYGSSLAEFIERLGYGHKLKLTFHYVDTDYYRPVEVDRNRNDKFQVVCVGSLLRDMQLLKQIVLSCPEATFLICGGIKDLNHLFAGQSNVVLSGYLPEDELLLKIQHADACLSVMEDTIGSNAIVSGLSCGKPQIVSDVGSIRDYCSSENTFFCKELDDYVKAIRVLSRDRVLCRTMGKSAYQRAQELSLPESVGWFRDFFEKIIQDTNVPGTLA